MQTPCLSTLDIHVESSVTMLELTNVEIEQG